MWPNVAITAEAAPARPAETIELYGKYCRRDWSSKRAPSGEIDQSFSFRRAEPYQLRFLLLGLAGHFSHAAKRALLGVKGT
jgi:hypothetical protein